MPSSKEAFIGQIQGNLYILNQDLFPMIKDLHSALSPSLDLAHDQCAPGRFCLMG